jgi:hypothetical protein
MASKSTIWVTDSIVGFHSWNDAPAETAYLSSAHRHIFHIKLFARVRHGDRDIEFHDLKRRLRVALSRFPSNAHGELEFGEMSCEMIAERLLVELDLDVAEVSEDGECGAVVEKE